jgi:hypothetical protein
LQAGLGRQPWYDFRVTGDVLPNEPIHNFVLPIVKVRPGAEPDTQEFVALLGTCFVLADAGGLAMTAKHVANTIVIGETAVLFNRHGVWEMAAVQGAEKHPVEDVALIRMEPGDYPAPFRLSRFHAHAASQYMVWGYPEAVLLEGEPGRGGVVLARPDLAYSEGHIRRRLTGITVHGILGARFYELSAIAGHGCSGGPVTLRTPNMQWSVVGVYVGERLRPETVAEGRVVDSAYSVGIATRVEDLDDRQQGWSSLYT